MLDTSCYNATFAAYYPPLLPVFVLCSRGLWKYHLASILQKAKRNNMEKPKLLDEVRSLIRLKHYSLRTAKILIEYNQTFLQIRIGKKSESPRLGITNSFATTLPETVPHLIAGISLAEGSDTDSLQ